MNCLGQNTGNIEDGIINGDLQINGNITAEDAEFNNVHVLNNLDVDGTFNVGNSTFDNIQITNPILYNLHKVQFGQGSQYHYDHNITNIFGNNFYSFTVSNDINSVNIYNVNPSNGYMSIGAITTNNPLTLTDISDTWSLTNVRAVTSGMVLKSIGASTVWANMFDQELNTINNPVFRALTINRVNNTLDALCAFSTSLAVEWVIGLRKISDPYNFDIRANNIPLISFNQIGNTEITPNLDLILKARTTVITANAGLDSILTVNAPVAKIPIIRLLQNDVIKYNIISDLSNNFIINNFSDGGKGVISIDGATSLITLNDDVVINGYVKLSPITEPIRPVDGKTILYSKFDQDPYFNNSAGINYTTDNTGFRMVPPLTYCETSYFGNTLPVIFSGIAPEWVNVPTNVNLILGKTNIEKYTQYQTTGAQLSVFFPPRAIRYNLTCSFTCSSTSAGSAVPRQFAIWVNGFEQRGKQTIKIDDATSTYPISNTIICIIDVVGLISNIILLRVRNPDNTTNNVVVHDLSFIITELQ